MNVSIIVPAYNAAETIGDTLESLLAQGSASWEAVVVDDGSNDSTARIVQGFIRRDARIRLTRRKNGGEAAARNSGIAEARYEWLLFLDADDWIAPAYLEKMTAELAAHPELDAVHCGSARVAPDGTLVVEDYQAPTGDMFAVWARRSAFPVHACIVRKSLVETVGRFDPSFKKSPDWDLWQRIARTGARFGAVREVLAYYRMRPGGASLDARQMLRDGLRVLQQGHAPDPRVPHPDPAHAAGSPPGEIASQEFYLLCWCAGLVLGRGEDARPLLSELAGEQFPELYPDAVAQCIFDAATLPSCETPTAWEHLWPTIRGRVDEFLAALEAQSAAPDLARQARGALMRKALRHSPAWQALFAELEGELEGHLAKIDERNLELDQTRKTLEDAGRERARIMEDRDRSLSERDRTLEERDRTLAARDQLLVETEQQRDSWQRLSDEQAATLAVRAGELAQLERDNAALHVTLRASQRLSFERERNLGQLRGAAWVRVGLRLGILKFSTTPDQEDSPDEAPPRPSTPPPWQLRVAEDSVAELILPPFAPGLARVAIAKASGRKRWDVQLNLPGFRVISQKEYSVRFRARADRARGMAVGFAQAQSPWQGLGLYQIVRLTREWQEVQLEFTASADEDNARLHFDLGGSATGVEVTGVSVAPDGQASERSPSPEG